MANGGDAGVRIDLSTPPRWQRIGVAAGIALTTWLIAGWIGMSTLAGASDDAKNQKLTDGGPSYFAFTAPADKIVATLTTYALIALLIERFVMIFMLPGSLEKRRYCQAKSASEEKKIETLQATAAIQERTVAAANLAIAAASAAVPAGAVQLAAANQAVVDTTEEANKAAIKKAEADQLAESELLRHTPQFVLAALVCGILLSAFGFRLFVQFVEVRLAPGMKDPEIAHTLFYFIDVLLSGVLLAGGSQGIHAAIDTLAKRTKQ